jgi:hypothetical protein
MNNLKIYYDKSNLVSFSKSKYTPRISLVVLGCNRPRIGPCHLCHHELVIYETIKISWGQIEGR